MKTKNIIGSLLIAIVASIISVFAYTRYFEKTNTVVLNQVPARLAGFTPNDGPVDLTFAAEQTVHAVVHVTTKAKTEKTYMTPFDFFFGTTPQTRQEPTMGIGSGVIISPSGHIVTNNHVIKNATEINVKLNDNQEFTAKLIGIDPSTDLAVIKIEAKDLPYIPYGNSETLRLGEWVLAVGNPFNLTSTVTAGIISAKGRNLNILNDQYRIESFIQTDAALNPGNSGGALVNIKGELIGINTAIISPSGGYAGNSFAIPVTIVKKVVEDLIEYGTVQRAVLGIVIQDVDAEIAKKAGIDKIKGVLVKETKAEGAAQEAGIKQDDIIIKIKDTEVTNSAELQEQVSKYRPKDKITVTLIRDKKEKVVEVCLKNMYGDTEIVKADNGVIIMGATLAEVKPETLTDLGIKNGVKIIDIGPGKFQKAGIENGFIITRINNTSIYKVSDVKSILDNTRGGIYIEGIYPNGTVAYYAFGM